ncbi:MAG: hypothetical protein KBT68_06040, partial [bacterium]|nr:hypothetical protein [Candidatus Colisoma equi]
WLTTTPADVSPEPEGTGGGETPPPQDGKPQRGGAVSAAQEEKPAKKPAKAKKPAAAKKAKPAKKQPVLELSDEEVTRLGKLAPKSIAKLKNTLSTQFRVADVSATVAALEAKGVIKLDGNHVSWTVD